MTVPSAHDEPIVRFSAPPVVEVVAGLVLEGGDPAWGPSLAAFWQTALRGEFPRLEYQPPYTPAPANPQAQGTSVQSFQLELSPTIPFPRIWASSFDQSELVQLQPTYFACNWRKVTPTAQYDSWAKRRSRLSELYERLSSYARSVDVEIPRIKECEVTYVNHISASPSWSSHSEWWRIFEVKFGRPTPHQLDQISAEAHFGIEADASRIGTLYCRVIPARTPGGTPMYVLELTGRAVTKGPDIAEALKAMDACRQAIDETFVAVTTESMQQEWGRIDGSTGL